MLDAMEFAQCTPSLSQALRIKKLSSDGNLTVRDMEDILSEIKQKEIINLLVCKNTTFIGCEQAEYIVLFDGQFNFLTVIDNSAPAQIDF